MKLDISTVSYLPLEVRDSVQKLQKNVSQKFNTKAALAWVPHITIADRVIIPSNKFDILLEKIKRICDKTEPIKVRAEGPEFYIFKNSPFEQPYAIFVNVIVNEELNKFHEDISLIYKGLEKPSLKWDKYKPHVSLAYKDLNKENWDKAKNEFKEPINYSFPLDNLQLVLAEKNAFRTYKSFKLNNQ